jgi:hypothetical protein
VPPGWRGEVDDHGICASSGRRGVIDPITLEVLREAFVSIVREMRVTLVRTALLVDPLRGRGLLLRA